MQSVELAQGVALARHLLDGRDAVGEAERLTSGKFSETFRIHGDGAVYVLRIAPPDSLRQLFYEYRMMRQEPALHAEIQQRTAVVVPTILAHDFSREQLDRDYLLMNCLPGRPLSTSVGRLSAAQQHAILRRLGSDVAALHRTHGPAYGYIGPHEPMTPQARWADAFAIMWRKLIDDCIDCGGYTEADRRSALELFDRHARVFEHDPPASICHMDLWAANVLVDGGEYVALFDFDRACYGDPENDLAVAEYCGLTQPAFWEGYGARPDADGAFAVRRWFYLMYEHQKYIVIRISQRYNRPDLAARYANESRASKEAFAATGRPRF